MIYSEWMKIKFPKLENESSAKTYNYIKKAKSDTKFLRFLVTFFSSIIVVLFSFSIGSFLSYYTGFEFKFGITLVIYIAASALIFSQIEKKLERRIVQKKLIELVEQSD